MPYSPLGALSGCFIGEEMTIIVDSAMSREEALAQNPESIAPQEVLDALVVLLVEYIGFEGERRRGQIVVHRAVEEEVRRFFSHALQIHFPIRSVIPISDRRYAWDDERSCADNNSSGFNYRLISGTRSRLSNHAYGLAFDINPMQNMYVRYNADLQEIFRFPPESVYDPSAPGTLTPQHPLVLLMKGSGWVWGGDWTKEGGVTDYQHFEKNL